jgi:hypothetical protein
MFGLGKPHAKALYGAIFDIGSESVGVAITRSDPENTHPEILFSHRVHMRITKKKVDTSERVRIMKEALFSASLIISRDGLEALALKDKRARITQMLVTCSAPWSYTISRNVAYEGETELKVSKDLMNDLIQSAESEIEKHLEQVATPTELTYDIVERATIDVRVNDYPVMRPVGLHGKEISLAHVTGLIPREVIAALTEVEEKVFPETQIRAHTFMLVLYCVLRDIFSEHASMTIVHVTGDTTEFGIVEGDTLVESLSVPAGLESIVRSLMVNDKESSQEMYSLLTLYQKGDLTVEVANRVKTVLEGYRKTVEESLAIQARSRRFPKVTFILAPTPFTPLFTSLLEPYLRSSLNVTGDILTLKEDVLGASPTHDKEDVNLTIASRFFHKLHGCGEIEVV